MANDFGQGLLQRGTRDSAANGPVRRIQALLARTGCLRAGEVPAAGEYDAVTEAGVRRLQWYAANVPAALAADGRRVPRQRVALVVDGRVGDGTRAVLQQMQDASWRATGNLVQARLGDFRRIRANPGFKPLLGDAQVALFDRSFADVLQGMDDAAVQLGIHIFINQLLRIEGAAVSGAVVTPASTSAHLIGRAVDLQLGRLPGQPQGSEQIRVAPPGSEFARFREHAKKTLKCRYGGDFSQPDPPHFDRQVQPTDSDDWRGWFHFNQLQYRQALAQPGAIEPMGVAA